MNVRPRPGRMLAVEGGVRAGATAGTAVGERVAGLAAPADLGQRGERRAPGGHERILGRVIEGILEHGLLLPTRRRRVGGEPARGERERLARGHDVAVAELAPELAEVED